MEFKVLGYKLRLEVVIVCMLLGCLICTATLCSCSKVTPKEAFTTLSSLGNTGLSSILETTGPATPENCAKSGIYSTSTGCYDITKNGVERFINRHGGNRTPPGDY